MSASIVRQKKCYLIKILCLDRMKDSIGIWYKEPAATFTRENYARLIMQDAVWANVEKTNSKSQSFIIYFFSSLIGHNWQWPVAERQNGLKFTLLFLH